MVDYILIVDDSNEIKPRIESSPGAEQIAFAMFNDVNSAKRRLIQAIPAAIISFVKVGDDSQAGLKFAKDLGEHSEFAKLPVILICEELTPELLRLAKEVGAKALYARDVDGAELVRAIKILAPGLSHQDQKEEKEVVSEEEEQQRLFDDNFVYAQSLLTRSLHTIKTSGLLNLVDRQGVASVVGSVTAAVCKIEANKNN